MCHRPPIYDVWGSKSCETLPMSEAAPNASTTPQSLRQADARTLEILWLDGERSTFDVRALRLACGCATCVDEWSGKALLQAEQVPEDVHPVRIDPVGRYAIQVIWSDGHESGIYPFRRLRELAGGGT